MYGRCLFSLLKDAVSGRECRVLLRHTDVVELLPDGRHFRLVAADGKQRNQAETVARRVATFLATAQDAAAV